MSSRLSVTRARTRTRTPSPSPRSEGLPAPPRSVRVTRQIRFAGLVPAASGSGRGETNEHVEVLVVIDGGLAPRTLMVDCFKPGLEFLFLDNPIFACPVCPRRLCNRACEPRNSLVEAKPRGGQRTGLCFCPVSFQGCHSPFARRTIALSNAFSRIASLNSEYNGLFWTESKQWT